VRAMYTGECDTATHVPDPAFHPPGLSCSSSCARRNYSGATHKFRRVVSSRPNVLVVCMREEGHPRSLQAALSDSALTLSRVHEVYTGRKGLL